MVNNRILVVSIAPRCSAIWFWIDVETRLLILKFALPFSSLIAKKSIITAQQVSLCPSYPILSTFKFRRSSLVTQASPSSEDEEVANQVLNEFISDLKGSPRLVKELCTNHIHELCKRRKLKAAARLLQLLRDKHAINSLPAYNHLLAAACEENDTQIASHIFKDMLINYILMNSATYFNVAKAISKSNDLTFVQSFVKEISELMSSGSVTVINRIIYAFADCGHIHNAILVFDNMKSFKFKPDLVTYNTVLGILGKAGRVDEMLDVFVSMKKADIAPDIVSYNTLLHSLRKVGRFDLCVVLTKEMGKLGLQPDLITYTALIECLSKSGNVEESLRLFEDMKRGNIRPSIYIYRSLINNLKTIGLSELAQKFLGEMNEYRDDLVGPKDFKWKNR
uniref:pentatricopeptide repeat-containing protein At1g11900-like n=1 Tax=Erigeron canadensis TaxID=72917 RepID=UPI001CB9904F|nr:pentatricopeptide repeat-containing protein At1g11900-like [Erigeron canadensis]